MHVRAPACDKPGLENQKQDPRGERSAVDVEERFGGRRPFGEQRPQIKAAREPDEYARQERERHSGEEPVLGRRAAAHQDSGCHGPPSRRSADLTRRRRAYYAARLSPSPSSANTARTSSTAQSS